MNYALKEANDKTLPHNGEKYQVFYLQERIDKTILKCAALRISAHYNIQGLIEEHSEALNMPKDNSTIEIVEELYKLRYILEDKEKDSLDIG